MNEVLLADREMDVMTVLWERGSGTVAEVRDALDDDLAYNTVLTVLRTLEKKGVIAHVVAGQAHRYVPLVAQATARRSALQRLVDKLFGGAPEQLLSHMVDERSLTVEDLRRMRAQIDELEARATDGGDGVVAKKKASLPQRKRKT